MIPDFTQNSRTNIYVPAAILDFRVGIKQNFFHHFVDKSYTGKVAKAFPKLPRGYVAAAKRSAWGVILPPLAI